MKGYRFYEEFATPADKRKRQSAGNVVALCTDEPYHITGGGAAQGAIVGAFLWPDSPVCYGDVSFDYLRENCRRISEKRAREIHPALFARLDDDETL